MTDAGPDPAPPPALSSAGSSATTTTLVQAPVSRWTVIAAAGQTWAKVLAGPALCGMTAGGALILWLGRWPPETAEQRIGFIGTAMLIFAALVGVCIWRLQGLGLESLKLNVGKWVTVEADTRNDGD
jgi:hypothetical protein